MKRIVEERIEVTMKHKIFEKILKRNTEQENVVKNSRGKIGSPIKKTKRENLKGNLDENFLQKM